MEAAVAAATAAAKAAAAVSAAAAAPVWREAQQNAARIGFHEGKYLLQDRLQILVAVSSASNLIQALNDKLRGKNNTKQPTSVYSWSGTCSRLVRPEPFELRSNVLVWTNERSK